MFTDIKVSDTVSSAVSKHDCRLLGACALDGFWVPGYTLGPKAPPLPPPADARLQSIMAPSSRLKIRLLIFLYEPINLKMQYLVIL